MLCKAAARNLKVEHSLGVSQNEGYLYGGPHKDKSVLGSKLGSPFWGNYHLYSIFNFSRLSSCKYPGGRGDMVV